MNKRIWSLMARKFSGEASEAEDEELDAMIRDDPSLQYTYEMLVSHWKEVHPFLHKKPADQKFDHLLQNLETTPPNNKSYFSKEIFTKSFTSLSAAAIIIIAGIVYLLKSSEPHRTSTNNLQANKEVSEVLTRYGSRSKVRLPDSTVVWLNAGSRLIYPNRFSGPTREVQFTGEAYFDVKHDPQHPFIIHTGKMNISVLGTAFDVKSYPEDNTSEATLLRGSIQITFPDKKDRPIKLKPNQKFILYKKNKLNNNQLNQPLTKKQADSNLEEDHFRIDSITLNPLDSTVEETSWLDDKLVFNSETFGDLAIQLERWYSVHITFKDQTIKACKLTGTFENETIDQALQALQITARFHYQINKNNIIISQ